MPEEFDPYLHWLGIRDPQRPPNHYRLLGVELFESDPDVISNAADRQMAHVRTFQSGRRSAVSQKILNELAGAKVCLLNPQKRAAYDAQFQAERASAAPPPVAPPATEATVPSPASTSPPPAGRRAPILWIGLSTLAVLAAVLATVLIVGRGGEQSLDEDSDLAWSESEIPVDVGEPSKSQGGTIPDVAVTGQTHAAGEAKSDQTAKPEPGKQPDAKQAAKPAGQEPSKGGPPKKTEPPAKMEPKGNKPASKSPPEAKPPAEKLPPASQSIAAARTAMQQRNLSAAKRQLALAEKAASPPEKEEISRLNDVLTLCEEFWAAVRNGILECREGEILRAGGLSVEVVNRSDGVISVRGDVAGRKATARADANGKKGTVRGDADAKKGTVREDADARKGTARGDADPKKAITTFNLRNLPVPLALVIADKKLPEKTSRLPKAAFLIVDPEGDPRQARELCEQSARLGAVPSPGLTAELKEALAVADPASGPGAVAAKPPARIPVPDAETQQSEKKKLRDAFRARFAQARTPIDKGDLAADLLREAKDSKDGPAARFALFAEARDLALAAGEPVRFREVVQEIANAYEIDSFEEQTRALVEASETALPSPVRSTLAKTAIELAQDAIQSDSYDAASQLAKAGFSFASKVMASKGRDPHLIRQANELGETIPWYRQQHDLALQAEKALAQDPNNVKAAQFLGKYLALVKEQWDRGLPLLVKGEDATLKALAEAEQAARRSVTAAEMVKLADQWAEAAPSLETPYERAARHRAFYWYDAALPHLGGLTRERVVRAIDAMKQSESPRRK